MAFQVCENLAFINGDDKVKGMEVFEINGALLVSLMDESPCDERDDNRLDNIIKSLEAEINDPDLMFMESESIIEVEDFTCFENAGQMYGHDCWGPCDFETEWVDMDVMPSSLSDYGSWCIDPCGDEMQGISEFFDVGSNLMNNGYNHQFWKEL